MFSEFCRYRNFFVRYDEPTHVKHLKVEILPLIANDKNAKDIASELIEVRSYAPVLTHDFFCSVKCTAFRTYIFFDLSFFHFSFFF